MTLNSLAKTILNEPDKWLIVDHNHKQPIKPDHIYKVKLIDCDLDSYVDALNSIRKLASRRGQFEEKSLIWDSIEKCLSQDFDRFKNLNQVNNYIRGLYGCELPKHYREKYRLMFNKSKRVKVETPKPMTTKSDKTVVLGGIPITLSQGASITIGVLEAKEINFENLKSVSVDKIENGKLFGITLQS
jgi:hypothetical protein